VNVGILYVWKISVDMNILIEQPHYIFIPSTVFFVISVSSMVYHDNAIIAIFFVGG